jgi:hypothetical protein
MGACAVGGKCTYQTWNEELYCFLSLLFCVSGLFEPNEYWVHVVMRFDHEAQQAELLCWVSGLCVCVCVCVCALWQGCSSDRMCSY